MADKSKEVLENKISGMGDGAFVNGPMERDNNFKLRRRRT
jgi:hypothetical protein